jgi:hypothetical protein
MSRRGLEARATQAVGEFLLEFAANGRIELDLAAPAAQAATLELNPAALADLRERDEGAANSHWPYFNHEVHEEHEDRAP